MNDARAALWLLAVLTLSLGPRGGARADVPEALMGAPIRDVVIAPDSSSYLSPTELRLASGARLTREFVRNFVLGLLSSGRWVDVQLDAERLPSNEVRLVLHVAPRLRAARLEIAGNTVVDDDEILRALGLSRGAELERSQLEPMARSVEGLYRDRGFLGAHVEILLRDTDDPASKVFVMRVREGAPTRIAALRFSTAMPRGLTTRSLVSIEPGDVFDHRELERAVHEAEAEARRRGYYETRVDSPVTELGPTGASVSLPAMFGPKYAIRLHGYAPLSRTAVLDALALGTERLSAAQNQQGLRDRVVDLYRRHGFHDAAASVTRVPSETGETATLVVDIASGPQVDVVGLHFPGSDHFTQGFLRDQIFSYLEEDLPGSSLFSAVDSNVVDDLAEHDDAATRRTVSPPLDVNPRRIFFERTYEEAIEHIVELYRADGFLGVQAGPAELRRIDARRAEVVVPIVEGPQTMLTAVALDGNHEVTDHEIASALALESGSPFSTLGLEEARLRVQELYRDRGYFYATLEPEVRYSGDRTRAEITLHIVERFPVTVGAIQVRGISRTLESLVRERLSFDEGDLYRPQRAQESQDRLLELGIFTSVTIAPEDVDLPARVKTVIVSITERPGQYLDVTGGLSTGEGLRTAFEYGYRNLFGYAVGTSLRAQFSYQFLFVEPVLQERFDRLSLADRLERRITLGLTVPHIGRLRGVRAAIDVAHVRDNERDFGYDKNGISLTVGYRPVRRVTFSLSENLENNNVTLFVGEALDDYLAMTSDPRLQRLLRVPEGNSTLVETVASATVDQRDNAFNPTRGLHASVVSSWARSLRTESLDTGGMTRTQFFSDFVKLGVTVSGYVPVTPRVVLALQLRFGRIFHLDPSSKTYPNRRFFLGGVDTMRGYLQDALVPQDIANRIAVDPTLDPNAVVRGGDAYLLARAELRFPIFGPLRGGIFADVGNLWADAAQLVPWELRPTAGVGVRFTTPIGPIAFDYGVVLVRRQALREPFGALHFSIGLF